MEASLRQVRSLTFLFNFLVKGQMKSVLFYEMTHASKANQQTNHKVAVAVPKNELGATPGATFGWKW